MQITPKLIDCSLFKGLPLPIPKDFMNIHPQLWVVLLTDRHRPTSKPINQQARKRNNSSLALVMNLIIVYLLIKETRRVGCNYGSCIITSGLFWKVDRSHESTHDSPPASANPLDFVPHLLRRTTCIKADKGLCFQVKTAVLKQTKPFISGRCP